MEWSRSVEGRNGFIDMGKGDWASAGEKRRVYKGREGGFRGRV